MQRSHGERAQEPVPLTFQVGHLLGLARLDANLNYHLTCDPTAPFIASRACLAFPCWSQGTTGMSHWDCAVHCEPRRYAVLLHGQHCASQGAQWTPPLQERSPLMAGSLADDGTPCREPPAGWRLSYCSSCPSPSTAIRRRNPSKSISSASAPPRCPPGEDSRQSQQADTCAYANMACVPSEMLVAAIHGTWPCQAAENCLFPCYFR